MYYIHIEMDAGVLGGGGEKETYILNIVISSLNGISNVIFERERKAEILHKSKRCNILGAIFLSIMSHTTLFKTKSYHLSSLATNDIDVEDWLTCSSKVVRAQ